MPESRDCSLPDGLGDLIDAVTVRQQTEKALSEIEEEVIVLGRKLAPIIFVKLRPRIDHDLLFTNETELVLPKIREVTREVLLNSSQSSSEWMVETISQQVVSLFHFAVQSLPQIKVSPNLPKLGGRATFLRGRIPAGRSINVGLSQTDPSTSSG